eukprot:7387882-Prymnesium_polylepis.2
MEVRRAFPPAGARQRQRRAGARGGVGGSTLHLSQELGKLKQLDLIAGRLLALHLWCSVAIGSAVGAARPPLRSGAPLCEAGVSQGEHTSRAEGCGWVRGARAPPGRDSPATRLEPAIGVRRAREAAPRPAVPSHPRRRQALERRPTHRARRALRPRAAPWPPPACA